MALLEKEMGTTLNRGHLAPEEKLALFKSAQHRYDKMNRTGRDLKTAVIVHPDAMQRRDFDPIEETDDVDLHEGDAAGEPRLEEAEEKAPGEEDDHKVVPLKLNDFEDQLHPRYHDIARNSINLIEKHSTLIAVNLHYREVILRGRKVSRSSFLI